MVRTCSLLCGVLLLHGTLAADIGAAFPDTPVKLHSGEVFELEDIVGERPVYLKFWASWCVPCREQMPHLEGIYRKYNEDIEIISVNIWVNETEEAVTATIDEFGLTVPIAMDVSGALAQGFEFVGTPYHVLVNRHGEIVHQGYEADSDLDQKIELLASDEDAGLAPIVSAPASSASAVGLDHADGLSVLFFTATWCDWYLEDSRPSMSKACVEAQHAINEFHEKQPELNVIGLASRLWTGEKELQEYVDKYEIAYPVAIDTSNNTFFSLNVKTVPTLIVMKDGTEVSRTSELGSAQEIGAFVRRTIQ